MISVLHRCAFRSVRKRHNSYCLAMFILGQIVKRIIKSNSPKLLIEWLLSITIKCQFIVWNGVHVICTVLCSVKMCLNKLNQSINNLKNSSEFSWSLSSIIILKVSLTRSPDHSSSPPSLFIHARSRALLMCNKLCL